MQRTALQRTFARGFAAADRRRYALQVLGSSPSLSLSWMSGYRVVTFGYCQAISHLSRRSQCIMEIFRIKVDLVMRAAVKSKVIAGEIDRTKKLLCGT